MISLTTVTVKFALLDCAIFPNRARIVQTDGYQLLNVSGKVNICGSNFCPSLRPNMLWWRLHLNLLWQLIPGRGANTISSALLHAVPHSFAINLKIFITI